VRLEKVRLDRAVNPVANGAELVLVGAGEPVTQRDVAARRHAEQSQAGTARIRLAHALVNFLERVLDVRESMMQVPHRGFLELDGECPELIQHPIKSVVVDRVLQRRRRRDRSKADF
jgi:hypothetical protein